MLGVFTLQPWGLAGAIMHMISYSTLKVSFFFCAGIISELTGETLISKMGGVGRKLPKTMVVFSIATLGMIGMLPLNTFWGKYYLMKGSVESGRWQLAVVLIISGVINAFCFIPVIIDAYRGEEVGKNIEKGSRVALMLVPTVILAMISLLIGLWPGIVWPGGMAVVNWFF